MKITSPALRLFSFWILLVFVVSLSAPQAWAKKSKCDGQKGGKKALAQSGEYCMASEAADKAAKNQQLLMAIHGGAAGICVIGCAAAATVVGASWGIPTCMGASLAAGVADIVTTQQFTGAASALVGSYGLVRSFGLGNKLNGTALSGLSKALADPSKGAANAKDAGAKTNAALCFLTVAIEGAMAVMNGIGAQKSKKSADENRKRAEEIIQTNTPSAPTSPGSQASAPALIATSPGQFNSSPTGVMAAATTNSADSSQDSSRTAATSESVRALNDCSEGNFASRLECFKSAGIQLPAIAMTPEFIPSLERFSGMKADDLLSKSDAQSVVGSVVGDHLGPEYAQVVQQAMNQIEAAVLSAPQSSSSRSAVAASDSGSMESSMNALLSGLQKTDSDSSEGRVEAFQKPTLQANTEGLETDRSVSLFDRISQRYRISQDRVASRGFSSRQNKILSR